MRFFATAQNDNVTFWTFLMSVAFDMMNSILNYIIIDDDSLHNFICNLIITSSVKNSNVKMFTNPEKGLEFIKNNSTGNISKTIIFLDIEMPNLTGWEFLDRFDKLDEKTKGQYLIYILSSTSSPAYKERVFKNKNVSNIFVKPLTSEIIHDVASV